VSSRVKSRPSWRYGGVSRTTSWIEILVLLRTPSSVLAMVVVVEGEADNFLKSDRKSVD
jgi:hypothetical protein